MLARRAHQFDRPGEHKRGATRRLAGRLYAAPITPRGAVTSTVMRAFMDVALTS